MLEQLYTADWMLFYQLQFFFFFFFFFFFLGKCVLNVGKLRLAVPILHRTLL